MVKLWLFSSFILGSFTGLYASGGNSEHFLAALGLGICFWLLMLMPMLKAKE